MPTLGLAIAAIAALVSFFTAWFIMRRAGKLGLLQQPNGRSSHVIPTPGGGGVGIVAGGSVAGLLMALLLPWLGVPVIMAGILLAFIGYTDDRRPIAARWRLGAQVLLMGAIVAVLPIDQLGLPVPESVLLVILTLGGALWINLFNFMDGIDGIAGIEAVTVAAGGATCWWLATGTPLWAVPLLLAAAVAGFLVLNYPPAKIFMGDVGSGFIGMMLGVLSLWTAQQATQVYWAWFILIGCFMVDATTTLLRRVRRGERFYEAHRSHAYQYAARRHGSHKAVSLAVGAINLLWLLPLALAVAMDHLDGVVGVLIAYAPLVGLAYRYRAGDRAAQTD